jgi:hypothetical protein
VYVNGEGRIHRDRHRMTVVDLVRPELTHARYRCDLCGHEEVVEMETIHVSREVLERELR